MLYHLMIIPQDTLLLKTTFFRQDARNDLIIPQYAESTVNHIIRRPSVLNMQSPLTCLITRNMITRQLDNSHLDSSFAEVRIICATFYFSVQVRTEAIVFLAIAQVIRRENSTQFEPRVANLSDDGSASQIHIPPKTPANENIEEIPVVQPLGNVNNTVENIPNIDGNFEDVEKPRAGQSSDASLILSLNTSSLTIR